MDLTGLEEKLQAYLEKLNDDEATALIERLTLNDEDVLETDIDQNNNTASTNNILAVLSDRRF